MDQSASETGTIEVRIREVAQLFNSFDPSPFHERDLDHDAEAYILSWARELPDDTPLRIVVHLPKPEAQKAEQRGLASALSNYFRDRAGMAERELRELMRNGRRYLSIGIPILIGCLTASQLASHMLGAGPLARAVEESLIIVGWVANWKPIETFLYDRWPVVRQRDLYARLAAAEVEVRARPETGA